MIAHMRSSVLKQPRKRKRAKVRATTPPATNSFGANALPLEVAHPRSRLLAVAFGVLAVVTLTLYSPVLHNPFISYDDPDYVTQNPNVQSGLGWPLVKWAFTTTAAGNWHPLTWLSHGLDCQLFGLNAGGHHATSALLHAANVILLFLFLLESTRAWGRSFFVAALFAVHPICVESVAWAAERKNVLCTFFFLLTLISYCWYVRKPKLQEYFLTVLFFIAALASKPMAVTLPFVLLLMDFWPLRRVQTFSKRAVEPVASDKSFASLILEKAPFFVLSAISAVITIVEQHSAGAIDLSDNLTPSLCLGNVLRSYILYLWKAIWPHGYAPFYPWDPLPAWHVVIAFLVLSAATLFACRQGVKRPYVLFGWLWFLGTLVPVIGLIQVGSQSMADRYAYIPLIGIFVAISWTAADFLDSHAIPLAMRPAGAAFVILVLSVATWRQIGYWRSDYDLWNHALQVTKNNLVAEDSLGLALLGNGRYDDALGHFRNAERIGPNDATSHLNIGIILERKGDVQGAIAEYETSILLAHEPITLAIGHDNLGSLYQAAGDYAKARDNLIQALKANPRQTDALFKLGQLESGHKGSQ